VAARFYIILNSGRRVPAVSVSKQGDDYVVHGVTGGHSTYPKNLVKTVEKVPVAKPVPSTLISSLPTSAAVPGSEYLPKEAVVKRVIDGDTIELEGGESVRLIGIDTPETVHPSKPVEWFGREASAYTTGMLEGQRVILKYDPANTAINHLDKYDRLLAYVHRVDGVDFNATIIKKGYAHAYTNYPFARMEEFRRYEAEAREKQLGLWSPNAEQGPRPPPSSRVGRPVRAGLLDTSQAADNADTADEEMPSEPEEEVGNGQEGGFWLTSSSGVRHNSGCRWYKKSNGRECGSDDGRACKICGG
jgi:endonuclease YncB( thermonuclease family)